MVQPWVWKAAWCRGQAFSLASLQPRLPHKAGGRGKGITAFWGGRSLDPSLTPFSLTDLRQMGLRLEVTVGPAPLDSDGGSMLESIPRVPGVSWGPVNGGSDGLSSPGGTFLASCTSFPGKHSSELWPVSTETLETSRAGAACPYDQNENHCVEPRGSLSRHSSHLWPHSPHREKDDLKKQRKKEKQISPRVQAGGQEIQDISGASLDRKPDAQVLIQTLRQLRNSDG